MRRVILLLGLVLLPSCGTETSPLDPNSPRPARLDMTSSVYVALRGEATLHVTAYNAAGRPVATPDLEWVSSSPAVALVSASGLVAGLARGIARITATGGGLSASTEVAVGLATVQLSAFPDPSTFVNGATITVLAAVTDSTGESLSMPALVWSTGNPAVASIQGLLNGREAAVSALSAGTTTITAALAGGPSGSISLTVLPPLSGPSGYLTAAGAFSVAEYQYPGDDEWFYAPLLRVEAVGGGVDILKLTVTIPGLDPAPPFCASLRLGDSQISDLNPEVYGDYMISVDESGRRATSGDSATAVVTYRTADGSLAQLTLTGPVEQPGLPTTYSAPAGVWGTCWSGSAPARVAGRSPAPSARSNVRSDRMIGR